MPSYPKDPACQWPYPDGYAIAAVALTAILFFPSFAACFLIGSFPFLGLVCGMLGLLTWGLFQSGMCIRYNQQWVYTTMGGLGILMAICTFVLRARIMDEKDHDFDTWCNDNIDNNNAANQDDESSSSCSNMRKGFGVMLVLSGILWLLASLLILFFAWYRLELNKQQEIINQEQAQLEAKTNFFPPPSSGKSLDTMEKGEIHVAQLATRAPKVQKGVHGSVGRATSGRDELLPQTEHSDSTTTTRSPSPKTSNKFSVRRMTGMQQMSVMSPLAYSVSTDSNQPPSVHGVSTEVEINGLPRDSIGSKRRGRSPTKRKSSQQYFQMEDQRENHHGVPLNPIAQDVSSVTMTLTSEDFEPHQKATQIQRINENEIPLRATPQLVRDLTLHTNKNETNPTKGRKKKKGGYALMSIEEEVPEKSDSRPLYLHEMDPRPALTTDAAASHVSELTLDEALFSKHPGQALRKRKSSRKARKVPRVTDEDVLGTLKVVPEDVSVLESDIETTNAERPKRKKKKRKKKVESHSEVSGEVKKKKKKKSSKKSSSGSAEKKKKKKVREYPDDGINLASDFAPSETDDFPDDGINLASDFAPSESEYSESDHSPARLASKPHAIAKDQSSLEESSRRPKRNDKQDDSHAVISDASDREKSRNDVNKPSL